MKEISVGATVAQAYRFAFLDFAKILKAIWLPWAILCVAGIYPLLRLIDLLEAASTQDASAALRQLWIVIPFLVLGIILYCSQIACVLQLALQPSRQQGLFHLELGKPVWRLLGAFGLAFLLYLGAGLASMLAGVAVSMILAFFVTAANLKTVIAINGLIASLLTYGAFICLTARPVFLMAPAAIAEEKVSLRRPWALGRGNFLRLMLTFIAVFLPFWVIQRAVLLAIMPASILLAVPAGASTAVKAAVFANLMDWFAKLLGSTLHYWYISFPLGLVWMVLYLGAFFGAQVFAYRALTQDEASAPVAAD